MGSCCAKNSVLNFDNPPMSNSKENQEANQIAMHEQGIFAMILKGDIQGIKDEVDRDEGVLDIRDNLGAAPIHLAFLYEKYDVGKFMVSEWPQRADYVYSDGPYKGENILHIAIIQQRIDMVIWLLERCPTLYQAQAVGDFFEPGNPCYFGGFPPGFAVAVGRKDILDVVLAAMERSMSDCSMPCAFITDSYGNTLLHIAVIHNLPEMYDAVMDWCVKYLSKDKDHTDRDVTTSPRDHKMKGRKPNEPTNQRFVEWSQEKSGQELHDFEKWTNNDMLTPLSLAAALGLTEMFKHLLKRRDTAAWSYGPVKSHMMPLEEIEMPSHMHNDETGEPERSDAYTVFEVIGSGRRCNEMTSVYPKDESVYEEIYQNRCSLLVLDGVKEIIDRKWTTFGKKYYLRAVGLQFLTLITFAIGSAMPYNYRTSTDGKDNDFVEYPIQNTLVLVSKVLVGLVCAYHIYCEVRQIIRRGTRYFTATYGVAFLDQFMTWKFSILVLSAYALELSLQLAIGWEGTPEQTPSPTMIQTASPTPSSTLTVSHTAMEVIATATAEVAEKVALPPPGSNAVNVLIDTFLAIAAAVGWFHMFLYLIGKRLTGPLIVMILDMVKIDMTRFFLIYAAVLIGFSQAIYTLGDFHTAPGFDAFIGRFKDLALLGLTGEVGYENYEVGSFPLLSQILVFIYIALVLVLLLNLLIAMMGGTYENVVGSSVRRWYVEKVNLMLRFESNLSWNSMTRERLKYSVMLSDATTGVKQLFLEYRLIDHDWRKNKNRLVLPELAEDEFSNKLLDSKSFVDVMNPSQCRSRTVPSDVECGSGQGEDETDQSSSTITNPIGALTGKRTKKKIQITSVPTIDRDNSAV